MTGRQLPLELPVRPAMGTDDFLVAPGNAAAVAWLDRWPDWKGPALVVYGPAGCGKTHLAHVWQARSGARLMALRDLTEEAVPALLAADMPVAIDDADSVYLGLSTERALLHLFNGLREAGRNLLLLASAPPSRWGLELPDLASRLNAAPSVAVEPPDDELLAAVLVKLFADRQLRVSEDLIDYLVHHGERSFAAARSAVEALDRAALADHRRVTVALARQVLPEPAD